MFFWMKKAIEFNMPHYEIPCLSPRYRHVVYEDVRIPPAPLLTLLEQQAESQSKDQHKVFVTHEKKKTWIFFPVGLQTS